MSTQTTNRISVEVGNDLIDTCKSFIAGLNDNLPFLIGLTPKERQAIPKINVDNKVFVEDAYSIATNNPHFLPAYMVLDEMRKDINGYTQLDELVILIGQLADKLRDTQMLMGSEAYSSALTVYRLTEGAARDGVPGAEAAYRILAERFKNQGNSGSHTQTEETGPQN